MPLVVRQSIADPTLAAPSVGTVAGATTVASLAPTASGLVIDDSAPADNTLLSVAQAPSGLTTSVPDSPSQESSAEQSAAPHGAAAISTGTIVGACVGAFVLLILILLFAFWVVRRQSRQSRHRQGPRTPYSEKEKDRRKSHAEFWHRLDDVLPDRRPSENDVWEREQQQGAVRLRNAAASPIPSPSAVSFQKPHLPHTVHVESWGSETAVDTDEHWKRMDGRDHRAGGNNKAYDSFLSLKSISPTPQFSDLPSPPPQSYPSNHESSSVPWMSHPFASPAATTVPSHKAQGSELSAIDRLIVALEIETLPPRSPDSDYLSTRSFPMPPRDR